MNQMNVLLKTMSKEVLGISTMAIFNAMAFLFLEAIYEKYKIIIENKKQPLLCSS